MKDFKQRNFQFAFPMTKGESISQMAQRLYTLLDEARTHYAAQNVLLVSHGSATRVMNTYFTETDNTAYQQFSLPNCGILHYSL